jgi:hypothetical protein
MIPSDRLIRMSAAVINHGDPITFGVVGAEEQAAWDTLVGEVREASARGVTSVMPSEYFGGRSDRGGNIVKYSDEQPRDELGRFSTDGSAAMTPTQADEKIWKPALVALNERNEEMGVQSNYELLHDPNARIDMKEDIVKNISERMADVPAEDIVGAISASIGLSEGDRMDFEAAASSMDGVIGLENMWFVALNNVGQLDVQDGTFMDPGKLNYETMTTDQAQSVLDQDPENQFVLAGTPEAEALIRQAGVSMLVNTWAQTSNDTNPLSLAMQDTAQRIFGLNDAASWAKTESVAASVDAIAQEHSTVLESFLQAQYDATQDYLKTNGINSITLYRGQAVGTGFLKGDYESVKTVEFESRPLSSWSTSPVTAYSFAGDQSREASTDRVVLKAEIPADRIFSTAITGFGCLNERETVVLGGTDNVQMQEYNKFLVAFPQTAEGSAY